MNLKESLLNNYSVFVLVLESTCKILVSLCNMNPLGFQNC